MTNLFEFVEGGISFPILKDVKEAVGLGGFRPTEKQVETKRKAEQKLLTDPIGGVAESFGKLGSRVVGGLSEGFFGFDINPMIIIVVIVAILIFIIIK